MRPDGDEAPHGDEVTIIRNAEVTTELTLATTATLGVRAGAARGVAEPKPASFRPWRCDSVDFKHRDWEETSLLQEEAETTVSEGFGTEMLAIFPARASPSRKIGKNGLGKTEEKGRASEESTVECFLWLFLDEEE